MSTKPYKVDYDNGGWLVAERPTGLVLDRHDDPREAKKAANFLNGGNGFNGYTPDFFTSRLAIA